MELCTKLNYIPTEQDAKAKTINEVRCHMSTGTPNGKANRAREQSEAWGI